MAGGLTAALAPYALLTATLLAGGCMTVDIPEREPPAPPAGQQKSPPPGIVEPAVAAPGARAPDTPPAHPAPPGASASPITAPPSTAPDAKRAPGTTASPAPEPPLAAPATPDAPSSQVMDFGVRATQIALGMMGRPYVLGGITPDGFDCSGLVYYSFGQLGVSVPRDTQGLRDITTHIPDRLRRIGDLVFFHINGKQFSHVGFYVGEGRFLHAPTAGGEVRIEKLTVNYWARRYAGTRRLTFAPVNNSLR